MIKVKITLPRLMLVHFLVNVLILFLGGEGFSHRSSTAMNIIQLPLYTWPIWLFLLGKGWKRAVSVSAASFLSLIMVGAFLLKDENRLERRRFTTSLGQIYVIQKFDFDQSKELPDQIELENPLPFGFVKAIKDYYPKNTTIGEISGAKIHDDNFKTIGASGSYNFKHDGSQLQLVQ